MKFLFKSDTDKKLHFKSILDQLVHRLWNKFEYFTLNQSY